MIAKIPIIGSSLTFADFCYAAKESLDPKIETRLTSRLTDFCLNNEIFLLDSGASCFKVMLSCLKEQTARNEVIIPAYAPGILVEIVLACGLKPVLCDISLDTFNYDYASLLKCVSKKTLLVLVVHMFGMMMEGIDKLRFDLPNDVYIIEDCAQAMGSSVNNKKAGSFSETSFFSFGRGKNVSICGGGFIATRDNRLSKCIKECIFARAQPKPVRQLAWLMNTLLVSYVVKPEIYGFLHNFTEGFKKEKLDKSFIFSKFSSFQSALLSRLFSQKDIIFSCRFENGMLLLKKLQEIKELICPKISKLSQPVFNRLPFVLKNSDKLFLVRNKLWEAGIESSNLYKEPLHYIFDLGYKKQDFPDACFLAEGLLTLPVYPGLKTHHLLKMAEVIEKYAA
jgi:dTDP-4-amino-4,6-dideoxygalactose transaminase